MTHPVFRRAGRVVFAFMLCVAVSGCGTMDRVGDGFGSLKEKFTSSDDGGPELREDGLPEDPCLAFKKMTYQCTAILDSQNNLLDCGRGNDTVETTVQMMQHNALYDAYCGAPEEETTP